jgi:hypothetical protein
MLVIGCCTALCIQSRAMNRLLTAWRYMPAVNALWSNFLDSNRATDVVMEDPAFLLIQNLKNQTFSLQDYLNRTHTSSVQSQGFGATGNEALALLAGKNLGRASEIRMAQRILAIGPQSKNLHLYNAREYTPSLATQDNIILFGNPTSNP